MITFSHHCTYCKNVFKGFKNFDLIFIKKDSKLLQLINNSNKYSIKLDIPPNLSNYLSSDILILEKKI